MSICGKNECKKCEYKDRCANSDDRPQTNEEWLEQASTEEKAEFFDRLAYSLYMNQNRMTCEDDWKRWLKEEHNE